MKEVAEIINLIEKYAPPALAAPWDRSGLQVASYRKMAHRLAVMLDPTPESLQTAVDMGADMVLAHHPLTMQPRFLDALTTYHQAVSILLRNDIPLYSAHTSLDAAFDGPVSWLAKAMGLRDVVPLETLPPPLPGSESSYGFGFCGDLAESMPYAAFSRFLAQVLGKGAWMACGPETPVIRRVACCPGSGSSYAEAAFALGADLLITGDVKYHAALETRLRILDVGHFILEYTMMRLFSEQLAGELADTDVIFITARDPLAAEHANARTATV